MSIVSLEKFLYAAHKRSEAAPAIAATGSYLELSSRLMAAVSRSVLVGEPFTDLSAKLEELRKSLNVAGEHEAAATAREAETLLQAFQSRMRLSDEETADEIRGILDLLNNAFAQLHSRSGRGDDRMKHLEAGLNRAARMEDLGALRSQVGKMLEFVRTESKVDQSSGKAEIENLANQIGQAHRSSARFRIQLAGRDEAMEELKSRLAARQDGNLHTALFVVDAVRALRIRHGDEVANNILQDLAKKDIQSLAPGGAVYSWSANSMLLIWDHADATVAPGELPGHIKSPLECKAFVGTRIAVFNVALRSMVRAATGSLDDIVGALDRFAKGGAA